MSLKESATAGQQPYVEYIIIYYRTISTSLRYILRFYTGCTFVARYDDEKEEKLWNQTQGRLKDYRSVLAAGEETYCSLQESLYHPRAKQRSDEYEQKSLIQARRGCEENEDNIFGLNCSWDVGRADRARFMKVVSLFLTMFSKKWEYILIRLLYWLTVSTFRSSCWCNLAHKSAVRAIVKCRLCENFQSWELWWSVGGVRHLSWYRHKINNNYEYGARK